MPQKSQSGIYVELSPSRGDNTYEDGASQRMDDAGANDAIC